MKNLSLPLKVVSLSFEGGDGRRLIDDLSVEIADSSRTIIMGPNGAGKSLFLRLVHGLIRGLIHTPVRGPVHAPVRGEKAPVTWGGQAICDEVRRRQALVFQRPVLLRRSVAANIDFVLELRGQGSPAKRDAHLARVGLLDRAGQPARLLSGGEQQRLALARAMALEPEVLMLDEPTANLDPASVLMIEEIINELHAAGTKIILVTHDLAQARRLGDEIIFMNKGRIAELTSAEEFFKEPTSQAARDFLAGRIVV